MIVRPKKIFVTVVTTSTSQIRPPNKSMLELECPRIVFFTHLYNPNLMGFGCHGILRLHLAMMTCSQWVFFTRTLVKWQTHNKEKGRRDCFMNCSLTLGTLAFYDSALCSLVNIGIWKHRNMETEPFLDNVSRQSLNPTTATNPTLTQKLTLYILITYSLAQTL